jgi:tetratricopeptide (TPR) repeat protein
MSRRSAILLAGAALAAALGARADIARRLADIEAGGRLEAVFFRTLTLPGGPATVRRPPQETAGELSRLITASPGDAELYALRALENEQRLDFAAAEADWKKHAETAADRGAGLEALADFYARRLRPEDQLRTLALAARENPPPAERWTPVLEQRPSRLYARMLEILDTHLLPAEEAVRIFGEWMVRYPKEPALYRRALDFYAARRRPDAIADVANAYRRAFPEDDLFPVEAAARAAMAAGNLRSAAAAYDRAVRAASSPALVKAYFDLLQQINGLRAYFVAARAAAQAAPRDLDAAARLYFYYQQQGQADAAHRVLAEFRGRREAQAPGWTAAELAALAKLFEGVQAWQDAARCYFALYQISGADSAAAETGLAGLIGLLLEAADQPVRFGSGSLWLLRDIAAADTGPGFWNGIVSLLVNAAPPAQQFAQADQASPAYFRRAKAAELALLFASRFPNSPRRMELEARLIEAYALYGENDAVIREGTRYLAAWPDSPRRTAVALEIANAHARRNDTRQEFAIYEEQLRELAARAGGVPLGSPAGNAAAGEGELPPRSPEYARILDRYAGRLTALKRTTDALALFRRELDRNPDDPGLYERLAAFLEQNRLGAEVEQVYARALRQFPGITWRDKLARWYLRQKQTAKLAQLTREVVAAFSGTELASYFSRAVAPGSLAPQLYLELNRFANQRFPHHPAFVRNLLAAYSGPRGASDPAAYERTLRAHWWLAPDLRTAFLEHLTRTGKLAAELEALRAATGTPDAVRANPGAARLFADGEAWRCHFETAAPAFNALAAGFPADPEIAGRAAALERSLGSTSAALALEEKLREAAPADAAILTRLGEIHAGREEFGQARAYWDRIPQLAPGRPDGYLEAATLFWDYYQFADALRTIAAAREKLARPDLFAYESGAIHENRRDYAAAIREYARGALAGEQPPRERLLALARRPDLAPAIDRLADNLASGANPPAAALSLRVALLRETGTRAALESFLAGAVARATAPETLLQLGEIARSEGLAALERQSLERQAALAADPVEKLAARMSAARVLEAEGRPADAAGAMDALYRENPRLAAVVRAAVDCHLRNRNPRRAAAILLEAAGAAAPDRSRAYTLEAAAHAARSGEWQRGREILAGLLAADPYAPDLLTAAADTYARAGDDRGLRQFYSERIEALRSAPLPAAERTARIAALRRGLIPVLARLNDNAAAVDQYVEILNRYPEDEPAAREAARFAAAANLAGRLLAPIEKAAAESPRDPRWPAALARLHVALEDPAAAIAAYGRALAVRPDRLDWVLERARLAERLLRFADAAADYVRAYELAYRDPQWLEKAAEMRAREGNAGEAFALLRRARLEQRPDEPSAFFAAAARLEDWGDLDRAREMVDQGLRLAAGAARNPGLVLRGRIAARQRQLSAVLAELPEDAAGAILAAAGDAAGLYFTPEEKERLAADLAARGRNRQYYGFLRRAGLLDLEARWRQEELLTRAGSPDSGPLLAELAELQRSRGRFAELGQQLEAFARVAPPDQSDVPLLWAADAYRDGGRAGDEARVLLQAYQRASLAGEPLERLCRALLPQPARLAALAGARRWTASENALVSCAIERGSPAAAFQVIAARGARISPAWTRAYTALAGLYHASDQPAVRQSFAALLGSPVIGERLGRPVDRQAQLAGADWFPFAARYADYLALLRDPEAADYRAALVEARPADPQAYLDTGDAERSADAARAAAHYGLALELAPDLAAAHGRLALAAAARGDRDSALSSWRAALAAYERQLEARRVPPSFWSGLGETLEHLADAKALDALRPEVNALLARYVRRHGAYETSLLFAPLVRAGAAAGVAWIIELAREAPAPAAFLRQIRDAAYVPDPARGALHQALAERGRARVAAASGEARVIAEGELAADQRAWIDYLLENGQAARAAEVLAALSEEARDEDPRLAIRVAAANRQLNAWLAAAERKPAQPDRELLRAAAAQLAPPEARRLLRWLYDRELAAPLPSAASFLGAAEVRLDDNDAAGAVALLRRMTRAAADAPANFGAAAALLEARGRPEEAAEFRELQLRAAPWDLAARRALAALRNDYAALRQIAAAAAAPYAERAAAALALRGQAAGDPGSAELNLLAAGPLTDPAVAERPFYVAARLDAARAVPNAALRLYAGVLAFAPTEEHREQLLAAAILARQDHLAAALGLQLWPAERPDSRFPQAPDARRAALVRRLAQLETRLGRYERARGLFATARGIEPAPAARARDADEIRRLDRLLASRAENAARRPLVTDNLTQDHVVRPRLGAAP